MLVSPSGWVACSFAAECEILARQQAKARGMRLFRVTTVTEEVVP